MRTVPPSLSLDLGDLGIDRERAVNALVLSRATDVRDDIACAELCSHAPAADLDLLIVAIDQTPDERLTVWRTHASCDLPSRVGIVNVGEGNRRAGTRLEADEVELVPIVTVDDPTNLTELGVRTSDFLSEWGGDASDIAVCFHSLTALLDAVETERVFRFLQVLKGRLDGSGALAHFHLDPDAHDEETVNTIRATMDVVVEAGEEGWRIEDR